jgi:hypothetical protein
LDLQQPVVKTEESGKSLQELFGVKQDMGVFRCPNSGLNSGHEQYSDTIAILFLFGNNGSNIN